MADNKPKEQKKYISNQSFKRVESTEREYSVAFRLFALFVSRALAKAKTVKEIDKIIRRLGNNPRYLKKVERMANKMVESQNRKSASIWRIYFEEYRGGPSKALSRKMQEKIDEVKLDDIIKENIERIKSFPEDIGEKAKDKLRMLIKQKITAGTRTSELAKYLKSIGVQRADLIARTETGKAQTEISKRRSTAVGVKAYIWKTSNDRRVRGSHRFMRDVICFWNDPPTPGRYETEGKPNNRKVHPGEDFNCRCIAVAIITAAQVREIAKGGKVKVWRNGGIHRMNVNKVIEMLEVK